MRYFLLLLLLFACTLANAQTDQYIFSRIDKSKGLSSNHVTCILKDDQGFIWFGSISGLNRYDGYGIKVFKTNLRDTTSINDDYIVDIAQLPNHLMMVKTRAGWNVYDPATEQFNRNPAAYFSAIDVSGYLIEDVKRDAKGNFWFINSLRGLYQYNPVVKKTTHYYPQPGNPYSLYSNEVSSIAQNSAGDWWIIYKNGVIEKMDAGSGKIVFQTKTLQQQLSGQSMNYKIFIDADNDLWLYAPGNLKAGLNYYNTVRNTLVNINQETVGAKLNTNIIADVTQDNDGILWIATDHGGINMLDKKDFSIRYLMNNEDSRSISQNSINDLYKDSAGIIWVGTFKMGVNYFHENLIKFPLYRHRPSDAAGNSLPFDDVNRFAQDARGNLWIGTNGGGLIYFDRKTNRFKQYLHNPADPQTISSNVIVSLYLDKKQQLWIGTYFGGLNCFDGKRFIHYRHNDHDSTSLADDRIWAINEDSQGRLWIGTLNAGLDLLDRTTSRFKHFRSLAPGSINSAYVSVIVEDRHHNVWFGTANGVDVLENGATTFKHYEHKTNDTVSHKDLSNNNITAIIEDKRGLIWIGTRRGLNLFMPATGTIRPFKVENGLADDFISAILEDNNSNLWISTPKGLSHLVVDYNEKTAAVAIKIKNYDETDDLRGMDFNDGSALKTGNGELVFGSATGFIVFRPEKIKQSNAIPHLVFTDFQVFNESIKIGQVYDGLEILPRSIAQAKSITLKYNQNIFSLEFAALSYYTAEKVKYAYKLEGFNSDWLLVDARNRRVTFTNLDPGDYTFKVRATKDDGSWSDNLLSLQIHILPPFWKTPGAYFLYAMLFVGLMFLVRYLALRKQRLRFLQEQEKKAIAQQHDMDRMKIRFFTNVSHEFRTPLSLVITPLDKIIRQTQDAGHIKQLQLVNRNARRLLNLVNQLLDFRKLEENELRLHLAQGDIIAFIKETVYSFADIAESKKIHFSFHAATQSLYTSFDRDKLERIIFNLLSNAFKFTYEYGKIEVVADLPGFPDSTPEMIRIQVIDTGIGIDPEKQEKIFDPFFQSEVPGSMVNQGSGIGLSITREFVRLHNGRIAVKSEPGKGSCFTVTIPLTAQVQPPLLLKAPSAEEERTTQPVPLPQVTGKEEVATGNKKTILLVEDNDDFRFYLKENLREYYDIIEEANGKAGWQRALAAHPDLIVCDISMPEMNGIDLCKKIRSDARTSFIPLILLTAFTGDEYQIAGLDTGATDYMSKPFNFEILLSKIRNILLQQEKLKKTYQKQVQVTPQEINAAMPDENEVFIQTIVGIIEKNISNIDFSVEDLSRQVLLSRVSLYKKMAIITGKTPIEFIRDQRLQKAVQLLEKTNLTIAEIAYEVGFNPKSFTKNFKAAFHMLPSEYQQARKKENIAE